MRRLLRLIAALLVAPFLNEAVEPSPAFAAVVHQANPTHNLRFGDLLSLFEGISRAWPSSPGPNSEVVVLVERDAGSVPYQFLLGSLLNTTPKEYKRRLQDIEYRGEAPVSIKILNSDAAACQFVFNVPSSIAIVEIKSLASPASTACSKVKVLRIDGKLPGEPGYRLK
jgi:hypothetical protein